MGADRGSGADSSLLPDVEGAQHPGETRSDGHRRSIIRRAALVVLSVPLALLLLMGASGFIIFNNAPADPLQRADAIVVLAGEHDGREDYGLALARQGWAPTVVISDAYDPWDPVMRRVCAASGGGVEVMCVRAFPKTTRGEAEFVRRLAQRRSWSKIIVVTWRYHLPRARLVFEQCFSPDPNAVVMEAVPRRYDYSPPLWEYVYAYQYSGFIKALVLGDCG
jgi:uncharacterized SAM-binding protein YcdF (DUF218 family)